MQDYGKYYDCHRYVVMIGRPVYIESPDWNIYIFCYNEGTLSVQKTIPIIGSNVYAYKSDRDLEEEHQVIHQIRLSPTLKNMKALFIMDTGKKTVTEIIEIRVDMKMVLHKNIILDAASIISCKGIKQEVTNGCNGEFQPVIDEYNIDFSTTIPIFTKTGDISNMYKILVYLKGEMKCQSPVKKYFEFEVLLTAEPGQLPTCMLSKYEYSESGVLSHLINHHGTHIVLMGNNLGFLQTESKQITYTTIEITGTIEEVRRLKFSTNKTHAIMYTVTNDQGLHWGGAFIRSTDSNIVFNMLTFPTTRKDTGISFYDMIFLSLACKINIYINSLL
jgi:hypothetical protein